MRCLRCGKENHARARFCIHCGNNLQAEEGRRFGSTKDQTIDMSGSYDDITINKSGSYESLTFDGTASYEEAGPKAEEPRDVPPPPPHPYRDDAGRDPHPVRPYTDEKSGTPVFLYAMIGIISILILALSGFLIWSNIHDGKDDSVSATSRTKSAADESSTDALAEAEPYSVIGKEYYTDSSPDNPGMAYTNNSSPRFDLHKKKGDFEKIKYDGDRYTFAYPKFLFNRSIVKKDDTGESYYLYYEDEKGNKQIPSLYVSCYDDPGDIMERTKNLFNQYAGWCDTEIEKPHCSDAPFKNDEGISIADARYWGRSAQTRASNIWIILSNDGSRSHVWILEYPILQEGDEKNIYIDYVIENTYRYCSFGGTGFQPRSFEEYQKGVQKEKKKK